MLFSKKLFVIRYTRLSSAYHCVTITWFSEIILFPGRRMSVIPFLAS